MIAAKEAKSMAEKANLEIKNKCKLIAKQDILPKIEKTIIEASSEGKKYTSYSLKEANLDISLTKEDFVMDAIMAELEKIGYSVYRLPYPQNNTINIDWNER